MNNFEKNQKVIFKKDINTEFLNESMVKFIEANKNRIFSVEKKALNSVKLFKVPFWISEEFFESK